MNEPSRVLPAGTKIKVHDELLPPTGMIVKQEILDRRTPGITGQVCGWVSGHGGDVYWVRHDGDEDTGSAYGWHEFELTEPLEDDGVPEHSCIPAGEDGDCVGAGMAFVGMAQGEIEFCLSVGERTAHCFVSREMWEAFAETAGWVREGGEGEVPNEVSCSFCRKNDVPLHIGPQGHASICVSCAQYTVNLMKTEPLEDEAPEEPAAMVAEDGDVEVLQQWQAEPVNSSRDLAPAKWKAIHRAHIYSASVVQELVAVATLFDKAPYIHAIQAEDWLRLRKALAALAENSPPAKDDPTDPA